MATQTRLFAQLPTSRLLSKVKHFVGMPSELADGEDIRQELAQAAFLLLEQRSDGTFLFRYDAQAQCVGDTWHMSVQDAKDQASFEYPDLSLDWCEVPTDVPDAVAYGKEQLR